MQCLHVLFVQRGMVFFAIKRESAVLDAIGVTTHNGLKYLYVSMSTLLTDVFHLFITLTTEEAWISSIQVILSSLENSINENGYDCLWTCFTATYIVPTEYNVAFYTILVIDPEVLRHDKMMNETLNSECINPYRQSCTVLDKGCFNAFRLDGVLLEMTLVSVRTGVRCCQTKR